MNIQLRSGKRTNKTVSMVFECETMHQTKLNIALSLLCGSFNPLRKHSKSSTPINFDKLQSFKTEFNELLKEVAENMDVNIHEIEKF